jgi:hypothetical protein
MLKPTNPADTEKLLDRIRGVLMAEKHITEHFQELDQLVSGLELKQSLKLAEIQEIKRMIVRASAHPESIGGELKQKLSANGNENYEKCQPTLTSTKCENKLEPFVSDNSQLDKLPRFSCSSNASNSKLQKFQSCLKVLASKLGHNKPVCVSSKQERLSKKNSNSSHQYNSADEETCDQPEIQTSFLEEPAISKPLAEPSGNPTIFSGFDSSGDRLSICNSSLTKSMASNAYCSHQNLPEAQIPTFKQSTLLYPSARDSRCQEVLPLTASQHPLLERKLSNPQQSVLSLKLPLSSVAVGQSTSNGCRTPPYSNIYDNQTRSQKQGNANRAKEQAHNTEITSGRNNRMGGRPDAKAAAATDLRNTGGKKPQLKIEVTSNHREQRFSKPTELKLKPTGSMSPSHTSSKLKLDMNRVPNVRNSGSQTTRTSPKKLVDFRGIDSLWQKPADNQNVTAGKSRPVTGNDLANSLYPNRSPHSKPNNAILTNETLRVLCDNSFSNQVVLDFPELWESPKQSSAQGNLGSRIEKMIKF